MNKAELIVALDVPESSQIAPIVATLSTSVLYYKVGLEVFAASGPECLAPMRAADKRVFLDLKLHDIPRTVANAVRAAAQHRVDLLTVHAGGGRAMLKAAADAARQCEYPPRLLAVTTLTSLDASDLAELGIARTLSEQALALAELALASGIDGLVASVHEAPAIRARFGNDPILVTPGIRPASGTAADQKRVATPADAVRAGADFLVVGRPILEASDPRQAAEAILAEMRQAHGRCPNFPTTASTGHITR